MRFLPASFALLCCLLTVPARADVIDDVRYLSGTGNFPQAEARLGAYRSARGVTPEYLEAYAWLARTALAVNDNPRAISYARETQQLATKLAKTRRLDAEPHLPSALGAALEVEALALAATGQRTHAIELLRASLTTYGRTSIRARLQKNLNLLSLTGKPAPALQMSEHLGPKPVPLTQLKGKPVLLFFWAHWCGDCKAQGPILALLKSEYAAKGLLVMAPTQRYGYAAAGDPATPAAELAYIEQVRKQYYSQLLDVPAPVSQENFNVYGASTTPTLVLINRAGIVSTYHPGRMTYEELRGAIEQAVTDSTRSAY
jgi:thiol-disulfide isomerase/thioredoxin